MGFSLTAYGVALHRYVHLIYDESPIIVDDDVIERLLNDDIKRNVMNTREKYLTREMCALRAHVLIRSRFTEDVITEAIKKGTDQVIILGAGLDTCSLRFAPKHNEVKFYEIDKPDSQAEKKRLIGQSDIRLPGNVVFIPTDFEDESLKDRMIENGIEFRKKAVISWLGVTMYLSKEAVKETLAVCAKFQKESKIVLTYANSENGSKRIEQRAAAAGELWMSNFSDQEISELIAEVGFRKGYVVDPGTILQRYFVERHDNLRMPRRLNIAVGET